MEKYLVTIEFRYSDAPIADWDSTSKSKTITIGVYDSFEDACLNGNLLLEKLEGKFDIHTFPNGSKARKERFSKNGGCFGGKYTLVSNSAPFAFYAKIETLKYASVDETIDDVINARKRYIKYKTELELQD